MIGIKIALICAVGHAVSAALVFHLKKQARVVFSLMGIGIIWLSVYALLFLWFNYDPEPWVEFLNGIFVYGGLFYCLSHPITVLNTSLTMSIMMMLETAPHGSLSYEEIKRQYPYDRILSKRLERMKRSGHIVIRSEIYQNTRKGKLYANVATILKKFMKCYPGE